MSTLLSFDSETKVSEDKDRARQRVNTARKRARHNRTIAELRTPEDVLDNLSKRAETRRNWRCRTAALDQEVQVHLVGDDSVPVFWFCDPSTTRPIDVANTNCIAQQGCWLFGTESNCKDATGRRPNLTVEAGDPALELAEETRFFLEREVAADRELAINWLLAQEFRPDTPSIDSDAQEGTAALLACGCTIGELRGYMGTDEGGQEDWADEDDSLSRRTVPRGFKIDTKLSPGSHASITACLIVRH